MKHSFVPFGKQKEIKSRKKTILYTVLALAAVGAVCWAVGFGSNSVSPDQIPLFETGSSNSQVFVANYLSLMMGNSKTSEFNNIVDSWAKFLEHDKSALSRADYQTAHAILVSMRNYQDMKVRRNLNDPKAVEYFKDMAAATTFNAENMLNTDAEKASGKQLAFWADSQAMLNKFATPQWVDKDLNVIAEHGEIAASTNTDKFFYGAAGPETIKDVNGNMLMTQHAAAVGLLRNSGPSFTGPVAGRQLEESTIHNAATRYTHLFESGRLGNMLTEEDNQFARLTEEKLAAWENKTTVHTGNHLAVKSTEPIHKSVVLTEDEKKIARKINSLETRYFKLRKTNIIEELNFNDDLAMNAHNCAMKKGLGCSLQVWYDNLLAKSFLNSLKKRVGEEKATYTK